MVAIFEHSIRGLISVPLMLEYEEVLTRPEHLFASGLNTGEISALLDAIALRFDHVEFDFVWRPQLDDPDDEMVLDTAINGRADALITFNEKHFLSAASKFGIQVWTPREALEQLRSNSYETE